MSTEQPNEGNDDTHDDEDEFLDHAVGSPSEEAPAQPEEPAEKGEGEESPAPQEVAEDEANKAKEGKPEQELDSDAEKNTSGQIPYQAYKGEKTKRQSVEEKNKALAEEVERLKAEATARDVIREEMERANQLNRTNTIDPILDPELHAERQQLIAKQQLQSSADRYRQGRERAVREHGPEKISQIINFYDHAYSVGAVTAQQHQQLLNSSDPMASAMGWYDSYQAGIRKEEAAKQLADFDYDLDKYKEHVLSQSQPTAPKQVLPVGVNLNADPGSGSAAPPQSQDNGDDFIDHVAGRPKQAKSTFGK